MVHANQNFQWRKRKAKTSTSRNAYCSCIQKFHQWEILDVSSGDVAPITIIETEIENGIQNATEQQSHFTGEST